MNWIYTPPPRINRKAVIRWHVQWKCPVSVFWLPGPVQGFPWINSTYTNSWPEEAFLPDTWANIPDHPVGQFNVSGIVHKVKCWPEHFQSVRRGEKKSELRFNDRNYKVGDGVILEEWCQFTKEYTGEKEFVIITHVLNWNDGDFGLRDGYCMFSFKK